MQVDLLRKYPQSKRDHSYRRSSDLANKTLACQFGKEYFDGTREQGYGGYYYDKRWLPVAQDIIEHFRIHSGMRVLDVGCAKGFLMRDLQEVCPGLQVWGLDISDYAIENCHPDVAGKIFPGTATHLPFEMGEFNVVLAINVIHNLDPPACIKAVKEIQRVSLGNAYIQVDAYRNAAEKERFENWVLTAKTVGTPEMWRGLFEEAGYTGDYYWTLI